MREGVCPHCGSQVHREMEGYQQIMPAECEGGCHEFYGIEDNASADDEEILVGWWKGALLEQSNVGLTSTPGDADYIKRMRAEGTAALEIREAKDREIQERHDAMMRDLKEKKARAQRYLDEALF